MKKRLISVLSFIMVLLTMASSVAVASAASTVKVPAPEVTELKATCTSVTIKWEEHNDDDMTFLVYRSNTGKAGTWKKLAQTKAGAVSYTDKTVAPGKTYYYTVKSYLVYDGTTYLSDMSGKHKIKTVLEAPVFSLCGNGGKGVVMKWDKRNDASGFIIYKSTTGKAGSWSRLKVINSGKAGTYTDSKVEIGKTYYYCIKATKTIGDKLYASPSSKAYKMVIMDVAVPQNLSAVAKDDGVYFSFDKVPGTAGYYIYRSETGVAKSWTKIATTKSNNDTTYADRTAEEGKIYYYTAKSYKTVNGKTKASASAPKVRITNLENAPQITFEPSEIKFDNFYEVISVKLSFKNMAEDDKIRIYINGKEYTDEIADDEAKATEFFKDVNFTFEENEDKSTDDTIVLDFIRLAPGEGTVKVAHAKYSDIYAELKIKAPELDYDKDFQTFAEKVEDGRKLVKTAKTQLEAAKAATTDEEKATNITMATDRLNEAKAYFEEASTLLAKYDKEYKGYEDYKTEINRVELAITATEYVVKLIGANDLDKAMTEIDGILA